MGKTHTPPTPDGDKPTQPNPRAPIRDHPYQPSGEQLNHVQNRALDLGSIILTEPIPPISTSTSHHSLHSLHSPTSSMYFVPDQDPLFRTESNNPITNVSPTNTISRPIARPGNEYQQQTVMQTQQQYLFGQNLGSFWPGWQNDGGLQSHLQQQQFQQQPTQNVEYLSAMNFLASPTERVVSPLQAHLSQQFRQQHSYTSPNFVQPQAQAQQQQQQQQQQQYQQQQQQQQHAFPTRLSPPQLPAGSLFDRNGWGIWSQQQQPPPPPQQYHPQPDLFNFHSPPTNTNTLLNSSSSNSTLTTSASTPTTEEQLLTLLSHQMRLLPSPTDQPPPDSQPTEPIVRKFESRPIPPEWYTCITRDSHDLLNHILTPTSEELLKRTHVFTRLAQLAKSRLHPLAQLFHFGSTANGLALPGGDMDLYLYVPGYETEGEVDKRDIETTISLTNHSPTSPSPSPTHHDLAVKYVERFGQLLKEEAGMRDVKILLRARVPIVKIKDPLTNIRCDIGFDNKLAYHNTRLLQTYAEIDPRVRQMVLLVKYWAKRRGINEPYVGTLSSYCYVLMIIHFLQTVEPPILPVLQQIGYENLSESVKKSHTVNGFNTYFFTDLQNLHQFWNPSVRNTQSLGELLGSFFKYWAMEFPYITGVASIRLGRIVSKESKYWSKEKQQMLQQQLQEAKESGDVVEEERLLAATAGLMASTKDRFWLCVEDPFETTHNVGRPVDKESLYEIRGEFIRAAKLFSGLGSGERVLAKICERVNSGGGNNVNGSGSMGNVNNINGSLSAGTMFGSNMSLGGGGGSGSGSNSGILMRR